jgi:capsid protein
MVRRRRSTDFSVTSVMDGLRSDYRAAKETRFQSRLVGVDPAGSGADYHYANEAQFLRLRERARDYQRNDCIVGQAVRRLTASVVQDGFTLDVQTGDTELDQVFAERWYAWADDPQQCHSEGRFTFPQMERLSFQTAIVDGDVFALLLRSGAVQWVEAHRVRTPKNTSRRVVHGILLDELRRPIECWITREEANPLRPIERVADIRPYPFRDENGNPLVLQLCEPSRFSQTRGVSALAPVSETIGMHDDIQFATLVKAQMGALIAILRERAHEWSPMGSSAFGEVSHEDVRGYIRAIEGVSAGLDVAGEPGETIKMFSANVPSPEFFPHAALVLTFIAVNLELPLPVLLLDPSKTNFSGWRGAIDQARIRYRQMQRERIAQFHRPVYEWKVRQWLALDDSLAAMAARPGVNPLGHQWNPPAWRYIEPLKDASGDLLQMRNALNSPRRIQADRGREWLGEVAVEIVEDNAGAIELAIERALKLNDKHAVTFERFGWQPVHYRELISLPTPDGITVSVGGTLQPEDTNAAA